MARHDDDYEEDDDDPRPRRRTRKREEDEEDEEYEEKRPRRRPAKARRRQDDEYEDYEDEEYGAENVLQAIVPTSNPKALLAYYCGIFGLIPVLGFILGPLALLFGILGLRSSSRNRKVRGAGHAIAGVILGPLGLVLSIVEVVVANLILHSAGVTIKDLFI
jgi:hypothetical protein